VDRASAHVIFMASAAEEWKSKRWPKRSVVNPSRNHPSCDRPTTLSGSQARICLGLPGGCQPRCPVLPGAVSRVRRYRRVDAGDQSLLLTGDGRLVALDAKMTFDDNGLFRHTDLRGLPISTRKIRSRSKRPCTDIAVELCSSALLGRFDLERIFLVEIAEPAQIGCANSPLSSKVILASRATSLPSPVSTQGLISSIDASVLRTRDTAPGRNGAARWQPPRRVPGQICSLRA